MFAVISWQYGGISKNIILSANSQIPQNMFWLVFQSILFFYQYFSTLNLLNYWSNLESLFMFFGEKNSNYVTITSILTSRKFIRRFFFSFYLKYGCKSGNEILEALSWFPLKRYYFPEQPLSILFLSAKNRTFTSCSFLVDDRLKYRSWIDIILYA